MSACFAFLAGLDAHRSFARHVCREPRAGFLVGRPSRAAPGPWSTGRTRLRLFRGSVNVRKKEAQERVERR
jgi:hypothetical protein